MTNSIYRKTSFLLFRADLIGTMFTLGISELIWAITLFWPGNTFDRPVYGLMSSISKEEIWALIFLLSGVTQITIAMHNCIDHWFSKLFAGWSAALWISVVIAGYAGIYPPPANMGGDAALALASVWIWVRPFIIQKGEAYARQHTVATIDE